MVGFPSNAWTGEGWPDLLVWLDPYLFGLEVKQGKAHATPRQLSRLVWLRKHHVHAWIVRSPHEAVTIIAATLEGIMTTTFNDDILAELDAALLGGPATPASEVPLEALPDFEAVAQELNLDPENPDDVGHEATEPEHPRLPTAEEAVVAFRQMARDEAADADALERQADALEALVLEMRALNGSLQVIVDSLLRGASPQQGDPIQAVEAPTPRRRPSGRVKLQAVEGTADSQDQAQADS